MGELMLSGERIDIFLSIYHIDMEGNLLQEFGRVFGGGENWFFGGEGSHEMRDELAASRQKRKESFSQSGDRGDGAG
jgi:hypothetical protein